MLKKVLLKDKIAYNCGNIDMWDVYEKQMDINFPDDYKNIINYYGTGGIANFLWFLNPFEQDFNVNFSHKMTEMLDAYNESKNKHPNEFPFLTYPNKNGLLPWAYTDNGDELYWKMEDKASDWKIIIYEARSTNYYVYEMSISEFLYKLIINEVQCNIFSNVFVEREMIYIAVDVN